MRSTLLGLFCIATLLMVPATSYGAPPTQEATSEPTSSITVLGYGTASAAPDSVRVNLYVGDEPTYGPGGPEMSFVEPADLEHVRDFLVEEGVEEDTIKINLLSRNYVYGPSSFAGEVAFTRPRRLPDSPRRTGSREWPCSPSGRVTPPRSSNVGITSTGCTRSDIRRPPAVVASPGSLSSSGTWATVV